MPVEDAIKGMTFTAQAALMAASKGLDLCGIMASVVNTLQEILHKLDWLNSEVVGVAASYNPATGTNAAEMANAETIAAAMNAISSVASALVLPGTFVYLVDSDGSYLVDSDGSYLIEPL